MFEFSCIGSMVVMLFVDISVWWWYMVGRLVLYFVLRKGMWFVLVLVVLC